jgi:transposase
MAVRRGEVRFLGDVASSPARVERLTRKLAERYDQLDFCHEAGLTGYGPYRQIRELGHDCMVVGSSLIPKKPGERIKTNRRDAVTLARKRQQLLPFLLRHVRTFDGRQHWTLAHRRWLAGQSFAHPATYN